MAFFPHRMGSLEVICGSMFSGKSEELIRRLRLARIAHQRVQVFKPALDTRYGDEELVSHSDFRISARNVRSASEILHVVHDLTDVVGIDEVQFFDDDIVRVATKLANQGKRIVAAGLDQDYRGQPFGPTPRLMAVAEYVTKLLAVCAVCGDPANRSQRLSGGAALVELGASDGYEARCRRHFEPEDDRQLELLAERERALKGPRKAREPLAPSGDLP
ncbi:MAG: thymidine kinase [Myxococcales bacterium]|nr:thymidine kinase [Myxococcales bacterium]